MVKTPANSFIGKEGKKEGRKLGFNALQPTLVFGGKERRREEIAFNAQSTPVLGRKEGRA